MALIRRCDSCRIESQPPRMIDMGTDDWYTLYRAGEDGLNFCSLQCVTQYFMARGMVEGIA